MVKKADEMVVKAIRIVRTRLRLWLDAKDAAKLDAKLKAELERARKARLRYEATQAAVKHMREYPAVYKRYKLILEYLKPMAAASPRGGGGHVRPVGRELDLFLGTYGGRKVTPKERGKGERAGKGKTGKGRKAGKVARLESKPAYKAESKKGEWRSEKARKRGEGKSKKRRKGGGKAKSPRRRNDGKGTPLEFIEGGEQETQRVRGDEQERYVNLWFIRGRGDATAIAPQYSLVKGKEVFLRVQIAPYDERTLLENAKAFPPQEEIERAFPELQGIPIPLEVTLFSTDFGVLQAERTQKLLLERGKSTGALYFQVTPMEFGIAAARVCVFYKNHLLQALRVYAAVSAEESATTERQRAEVEMTFSADFSRVSRYRPRTLWLGINQNRDSSHTLDIKDKKAAMDVRLEKKIERALNLARQSLREVSFKQVDVVDERGNPVLAGGEPKRERKWRFDPENRPVIWTNTRKSKLVEEADLKGRLQRDLTTLADAGTQLCNAIFGAAPLAEDKERVKAEQEAFLNEVMNEATIQVARLKDPADIWPWAVLYDLPLAVDRVRDVCLAFRKDDGTLRSYAEGKKICKATHYSAKGIPDPTVVCPYGFWGFRHIIEQPTQPGSKEAAFQNLTLEIKGGGTPVLEMALATSLRTTEQEHIRNMEKWSFRVLESLEAISGALDARENPKPKPHVVYFFCHGEYDTNNSPYFQVGGAGERLRPAELASWKLDWRDSRGLVFINGCHTVEIEPGDLSSLMEPFINASASGIIGTEVTVDSGLARYFALEFFSRFLPNGKPGGHAGQIIKDLRFELLLKYNALGLVYTPYCSADLHMVR